MTEIANYVLDGTGRRAESGTIPITTVQGVEQAGMFKRTVLTLDKVPVSVVVATTNPGVGGTKVFDFPEGHIAVLGTVGELSIEVVTQADFTDGTPEGQIGIGTVAPADADALGTDATDDDFATATDFTMAAYVDSSVICPSEASRIINGATTPVDMYVNVFVDAADIDDGVTTTVLISGTITILWSLIADT